MPLGNARTDRPHKAGLVVARLKGAKEETWHWYDGTHMSIGQPDMVSARGEKPLAASGELADTRIEHRDFEYWREYIAPKVSFLDRLRAAIMGIGQ